ncbi:MAG: hypothetical protein RBG13Loki_1796 [Promethearchaeota archaeon CR_4]|nr:MAG: hypothetical protein RBG13Loki_1796 [Candidatus Lokiarchaeota archaeon CR_4]
MFSNFYSHNKYQPRPPDIQRNNIHMYLEVYIYINIFKTVHICTSISYIFSPYYDQFIFLGFSIPLEIIFYSL